MMTDLWRKLDQLADEPAWKHPNWALPAPKFNPVGARSLDPFTLSCHHQNIGLWSVEGSPYAGFSRGDALVFASGSKVL